MGSEVQELCCISLKFFYFIHKNNFFRPTYSTVIKYVIFVTYFATKHDRVHNFENLLHKRNQLSNVHSNV